MKIIVDHKIPFLQGVLEPFAEVSYIPGNLINANDIKDADALLIRTRTICDQKLLNNSRVRFIGSATIGFDHIDTKWCEQNGISWTNAPGCNAASVEQYCSAALLYWADTHKVDLTSMTIGIVGVGNVGSRVARSCELMGMRVLLNDPPRQRKEGSRLFTSLDDILEEADIISFHVPLTREGVDKTFRLVNDPFLSKTLEEVLLINTCRGEVFDSRAIIDSVNDGHILPPIIDCWEREPAISLHLLDRSFLGTPHIAGYSQDGKANGTQQIVRALARHFDLPLTDFIPEGLATPDQPLISLPETLSHQQLLKEAVLHTYPIVEDDKKLRADPYKFEDLRGSYRIRREYQAFQVSDVMGKKQIELLRKFNFNTK